jgi:hypothetical protein
MKVEVGKTYRVKTGSESKCINFTDNSGDGVDRVTIRRVGTKGISYAFTNSRGESESCAFCFKAEDLMEVKKELKDIEQGDTIVDKGNCKRMVLGRCGLVVFVSGFNKFESSYQNYYWTIKDLEDEGYSVYQEPVEPEEEVVEMTMAEVNAALGKNVKIKE